MLQLLPRHLCCKPGAFMHLAVVACLASAAQNLLTTVQARQFSTVSVGGCTDSERPDAHIHLHDSNKVAL